MWRAAAYPTRTIIRTAVNMSGGCVSQTAMTTIPGKRQATVTSGRERRHRNDRAIAVITAMFSQSGPTSFELVARSTTAITISRATIARSSARMLLSLRPRRRLSISPAPPVGAWL